MSSGVPRSPAWLLYFSAVPQPVRPRARSPNLLIRSYWQALSNQPLQRVTHPYASSRIHPRTQCCCTPLLYCYAPSPSCPPRPRRDLISAELPAGVTSAIRTNYRMATLCLQNRGRTESTFENFALSIGHLPACVRRRPPISARCCGTSLLY